MSHYGDYMEGVPVKISEKYKKPPRIELPESVTRCEARARAFVDNINYDCNFENNVLGKIKELRNAKEARRRERRHRLQLSEEAKQKKLDLLAAAEAERGLQQLSVSDVIYPSTDELGVNNQQDAPTENVSPETEPINIESASTFPSAGPTLESTVPEQSILQPVPVPSSVRRNNLLDDPDPLEELKCKKLYKIPQYNNIDKLTYSDFENDTSSPFDYVELKTINDMEQLAQVLHTEEEPCASSVRPPESVVPAGTQFVPPQVCPASIYASTNGYYLSADTACDYGATVSDLAPFPPGYLYPANPEQLPPVGPVFYSAPSPLNNSYISQPYYYGYPQISNPYQGSDFQFWSVHGAQIDSETDVENCNGSAVPKSRSRSIPDIVNELNEELASKKIATVVEPDAKLPVSLQELCRRVHSMGFPMDRVVRVVTKLGDDDKKVCLITLFNFGYRYYYI